MRTQERPVPTLAELEAAGRASADRIRECGKQIGRSTKEAFYNWLDQSERLSIARIQYHLQGEEYVEFAKRIGIDRSSAFELVKLHRHRMEAFDRCSREEHEAEMRGKSYIWPGWKKALGWFEPKPKKPAKATGNAAEQLREMSDELAGVKAELEIERQKVRSERAANEEMAERATHSEAPGDDSLPIPWSLFDWLNRTFNFTLHVAAKKSDVRCERNLTLEEDDVLERELTGTVLMTPPLSDLATWNKKGYFSALAGNAVVVALLPLLTDTEWFVDYASHGEILLLPDRPTLGYGKGVAPFPCMIVVRRKESRREGDWFRVRFAEYPAVDAGEEGPLSPGQAEPVTEEHSTERTLNARENVGSTNRRSGARKRVKASE